MGKGGNFEDGFGEVRKTVGNLLAQSGTGATLVNGLLTNPCTDLPKERVAARGGSHRKGDGDDVQDPLPRAAPWTGCHAQGDHAVLATATRS